MLKNKVGAKEKLREIPSVDSIAKSPSGLSWAIKHPMTRVIRAIREVTEEARKAVMSGNDSIDVSMTALVPIIESRLNKLSSLSLIPLINATGIVIHTNLGRSALAPEAMLNVLLAAEGYSNLEYDLSQGHRGRRNSHLQRLLRETSGAEDGIAVNNNAGAVLLALNALAKGKEVIVSRGELVEIGGSFRIPDVMSASGAILREVGTTNKTHLSDYKAAINENTGLLLKVHPSNYRITGFSEEVSIEELGRIGQEYRIPVMYDLGGGCLMDLKPFGIHGEPTVREAVSAGADVVTFSGDKLLGGPQAGIIVGKSYLIEAISKHPIMRAMRIDKMTLAALEATLHIYADPERARAVIPTLRMLTESAEVILHRAKAIARLIKKTATNAKVEIVEGFSQAGGGSLPEVNLKTHLVSVIADGISANKIEAGLRLGRPPVIARIAEDRLLLDARTIGAHEIGTLADCVCAVLCGEA